MANAITKSMTESAGGATMFFVLRMPPTAGPKINPTCVQPVGKRATTMMYSSVDQHAISAQSVISIQAAAVRLLPQL